MGRRTINAATVAPMVPIVSACHSRRPLSDGSAASGRHSTPIRGGDSNGTVQNGGLIQIHRSPGRSSYR